MAKKNREVEDQDTKNPGGFKISSRKIGKQKMVLVTMQLTEVQDAHLAMVARENGTTRAEFVKQATAYALTQLKRPLPEAGEAITEELETALEERREKRRLRREARSSD